MGVSEKVVVGTRGSALAMWQTNWVVSHLQEAHPGVEFAVKEIKTEGDRVQNVALSKIGDRGLFVKELERALEEREIDMAVHSLKDMPTDMPAGLVLTAMTEREDPRDVLVSRLGLSLKDLPQGARIGTSSLRRSAQVLSIRPDARIVDLRGNVDTRLRKAAGEDYDGVILAAAGIIRMGWQDRITEYLEPEAMLPAVGQGVMTVETREDDTRVRGLLKAIDSAEVQTAITAERTFMYAMQGGCQVPLGALASGSGERITLHGMVASLNGRRIIRGEEEGPVTDPEGVGRKLAERLIADGAEELLLEIRGR